MRFVVSVIWTHLVGYCFTGDNLLFPGSLVRLVPGSPSLVRFSDYSINRLIFYILQIHTQTHTLISVQKHAFSHAHRSVLVRVSSAPFVSRGLMHAADKRREKN
uniref:Putative secreted protein n=1 Tax=Anopheles marajoara TaxID=58244 RepID=A0A2M4C8G5_9DIPT